MSSMWLCQAKTFHATGYSSDMSDIVMKFMTCKFGFTIWQQISLWVIRTYPPRLSDMLNAERKHSLCGKLKYAPSLNGNYSHSLPPAPVKPHWPFSKCSFLAFVNSKGSNPVLLTIHITVFWKLKNGSSVQIGIISSILQFLKIRHNLV